MLILGCRLDPTATVMPADDDVFNFEHRDGIFNHTEAIEIALLGSYCEYYAAFRSIVLNQR